MPCLLAVCRVSETLIQQVEDRDGQRRTGDDFETDACGEPRRGALGRRDAAVYRAALKASTPGTFSESHKPEGAPTARQLDAAIVDVHLATGLSDIPKVFRRRRRSTANAVRERIRSRPLTPGTAICADRSRRNRCAPDRQAAAVPPGASRARDPETAACVEACPLIEAGDPSAAQVLDRLPSAIRTTAWGRLQLRPARDRIGWRSPPG